MNIKEKVYAALMSSPKLKALLVKDRKGRCIYPGVSFNAGSYPILVYNVISDVPALVAYVSGTASSRTLMIAFGGAWSNMSQWAGTRR